MTKILTLRLNSKGTSLLSKASHHRLKAFLRLEITHSPSKTEVLRVDTVIVK